MLLQVSHSNSMMQGIKTVNGTAGQPLLTDPVSLWLFLSLERSLCCSLFATFWLICIDCHSLPFTKHLWHNSIPSTKEYNMHVHSRLFENGPKKIKSIFIHNRFDLKDLPLTLSEETACGPLPPHLL